MHSMTGFGRAEGRVDHHHFTVEIKSVNHRYLDVRYRLPTSLSLFESAFTERLRNHFERGAFEVSIKHRLAPTGGVITTGTRYAIDDSALQTLLAALKDLNDRHGINLPLTLESVLNSGRILIPVEADNDGAESALEPVLAIFDHAATQMLAMRLNEGQKTKTVLLQGVAELDVAIKKLDEFAPLQPKRIAEKLAARIQQWQLTSQIDPQRLEWEVALYAEKADVSEELARLRAHTKSFIDILESKQAVGRKLDFLTQELNREVNTLSSKVSILEMTRIAVEIKTGIEKLREQVQNVE